MRFRPHRNLDLLLLGLPIVIGGFVIGRFNLPILQ